jgi:hypothetical protein
MRVLAAVLMVAAIGGTPTSALAQAVTREAPPGSPRMLVGTAFSAAIENGSDEALEALVMNHFAPGMRDAFSMGEHLDQLRQLSQTAGTASNIGFSPRGQFTVGIELMTPGGERTVIVVDFEATEPYLITGVDVEGG